MNSIEHYGENYDCNCEACGTKIHFAHVADSKICLGAQRIVDGCVVEERAYECPRCGRKNKLTFYSRISFEYWERKE